MQEVKNPEQQLDKSAFEQSPEKLRETDASRAGIEHNLDGSFDEGLKRNDTSEQSFDMGGKRESLDEAAGLPGEKKLDNASTEVSSRFSSENFPAENSYDARVSAEVRDLASKANSELTPMGEAIPDNRTAKDPYSKEEIATLKAEREKIDMPTENTVMQKVIGVDSGDIQSDLSSYLSPTGRATGEPKDADVYGFVSKAEDSAPFTQTPQDCYENLRLDYPGTEYVNPVQPVYVLRFTDGTNYEIPYNSEFDGNCKDGQPCSGNGYIAGAEHMIPEYKVLKDQEDNGAVITDGEIYRVNPDGTADLVAGYNKKDHCFELLEASSYDS